MSSLEKLKLKVCALCHQNSELELSHIIPKFAIRYLKETSIMENAERSQEQLSDRQQEKIKQRLQKAADKIEKYPIWDDFKKDREL